MTDKLAFLISQPRAGSTLLQAILGSHPEIHTSSEPWIALPFIYARKKGGAEFEFNANWSKNAISAFFQENDIDEEFYNASLNSFLTTLYQKALTDSGKKVFLDKTPRYYEIASELIKIFPEAKFIVLYRNPLSVLNSILKTWVKEQTDILYYYSRDLFSAPTKLIDFVSNHREQICLLRYEELVKTPEKEINRVCTYLHVPYSAEIINYKSDRDWAFGDKNFKSKKAPDIDSLDAWKEQLADKRTLNFVSYYLKELGQETVTQLGYDYASLSEEINSLNPNGKDLKTWKKLVHRNYIIPIEDQRRQTRADLQSGTLKGLFRKLIS